MKSKNRSKIVPRKIGNTGLQSSLCIHWSFTLNHYTHQDLIIVPEILNKLCKTWIFGEEIGEESKIEHLQGQITLKKKKRLTALKKVFPRMHWERTNNILASVDYCQKEGKVHTNMLLPKWVSNWSTIVWKPWQQNIIDMVKTVPNSRDVHWYWETTGNTGKSFLSKYLVEVHNALLINGKLSDICHQVAKRMEEEIVIDIVVLDIPRCSKGLISYQAIEQIKNGLVYSGKYEGGQYTFDSPHLIVFANIPPKKNQLSEDRWKIYEID